jgi:P27 family predicted phage terminase small subunit
LTNKTKPLHLHKLEGTFRKDRHSGEAVPFDPNTPDAPDILNGVALNEWNRVTPELSRLGLLTIFDRSILTQYCLLWEELYLNKQAFRLAKTDEEKEAAKPLSAAWNTQFKQIQQELGFTIASRSGLRMPNVEKEKPESKLTGAM